MKRSERWIRVICLACILAASSEAMPNAKKISAIRPVHTYSIIAYDPKTGELGAAVQSHWFKVDDVIWVEPGIGAVATQSFTELTYGSLGIEMMKKGKTAIQALKALLAADEQKSVRQVAMIDVKGNVTAHTGKRCIEHAGHEMGKTFSVQANIMENSTVWDAMAEAYKKTRGDLATRMMAALEAAQKEGGDIRGKQSAAMIVMSGKPTGQISKDTVVDIRVDDSRTPLKELRRLLDISRAYRHMERGDEHMAAGKIKPAGKEYKLASKLAPDNPEIPFWHAVALASSGRLKMSLPIFKDVFAEDEAWRRLIPRLVKAHLFPGDEKILKAVLSQ
ncbi:MAG: DUF1028 domain-containing protein [Deltaproteobacteria bacterium]|nr:DUF1028 domain-containing protein [Deltaproteobacteria bacterium]